jgi:hypothetical protein
LLLGVSAATRELWWMNQKWLELRWGCAVDQIMTTVHGTIPPRNSYHYAFMSYDSSVSKVNGYRLDTQDLFLAGRWIFLFVTVQSVLGVSSLLSSGY